MHTATGKLDYITALRGIAILMVIGIHTEFLAQDGTEHLPGVVSAVVGSGARGVQLFFVASAFTMFYSLSQGHRDEKNPTLNFFLRRFFRIAPAYWLGIVGYSLYYYYAEHRTFTLANTVAEFFFVHGVSPWWINTLQPGGWSITVEMCFYLCVPLLYRVITSLNRAVVFVLATMLLNMVLQIVLHHYAVGHIHTTGGWVLWDTFVFAFLPSQMPVFGMGFVFFFLTQPASKTLQPGTWLACAFVLMGAWATGSNALLNVNTAGLREHLLPSHWVFGMGFVLLALALRARPYGWLVNGFTRYIGELSFSLYLCHFLVIFLLNRYGLSYLIAPTTSARALLALAVRFLLICAGSIPLAWLLYRLVEQPGQRLGKYIVRTLNDSHWV